MTDPTTGPNDDALDAALRGMPRPVVDPARREMHIAAALEALETPNSDAPNNVVSLASRRRTRLMTLTAVAAAGLFVVGLGIGRVSAPKAETPSPVKNAALTPDGSVTTEVDGCPDLTLDAPGELVTTFGTYALYRTGEGATATLVVVEAAACTIVTRVVSPAADGG
ncbi:MAG: hypothetical protein ACKOYL_11595 [Actinomycetota bacterium]